MLAHKNYLYKKLLYIILFIGFSLYIYHKVFNVDINSKKIYVFGATNVSQSEIKKLITFNNSKINLIAKKYYILRVKPELKNVKIYRYYDKIIVKLYERIPEVYTNQNGTIFGIDKKDVTFPIHRFHLIANIPKINYKSLNKKNRLLRFIRKIKVVSNHFYNNIVEIGFNSVDELVIKIKNDIVIIWGIDEINKDILLYKLQKLHNVYKDMMYRYSKINYIDMSYYNYGKIIAKING
jgi:cell division septal protein FtsQ